MTFISNLSKSVRSFIIIGQISPIFLFARKKIISVSEPSGVALAVKRRSFLLCPLRMVDHRKTFPDM
jgi:hypothetical protein